MSEILKKENIFQNCTDTDKNEVILKMGELLYNNGYVEKEYIQGMLDKEKVFNTNIGNEVAIPHGIEETRKNVLNTGIGIMIFPQGIDWGNGEKVKIVIGIAAKGDEHLEILGQIAMLLSEPEDVVKVVNSDTVTIYKLFTDV